MNQSGLKKFIFTFGSSHHNAKLCQPIYAKDYESARQKMFDIYGDKWAFQYSEEEWDEWKERAEKLKCPLEEEMDPIFLE